MQISRSIVIKAPMETVWTKLVDEFVNVHHWMASIKGSSAMPGPDKVPGAPAAGRIAEIGAGSPGGLMKEKITSVNRAANTLEFETVLDNIKGFNPIIGWPNQIILTNTTEGTLVTWNIQPKLERVRLNEILDSQNERAVIHCV